MIQFKHTLTCTLFGLLIMNTTFGATLSLQPSKGELVWGCPTQIDIMIDTKGKETNTVDIKLLKNDDYEIVSFNPNVGVFPSYTPIKDSIARHPDFKNQELYYIMGTTGSPKGFNGQGKFGTITVIPREGINDIHIDFYAIPSYAGDDSNIPYMQNGKLLDALDRVIGGTYTPIAGVCDTIKTEDNSKKQQPGTINYKQGTNNNIPQIDADKILGELLISQGGEEEAQAQIEGAPLLSEEKIHTHLNRDDSQKTNQPKKKIVLRIENIRESLMGLFQ